MRSPAGSTTGSASPMSEEGLFFIKSEIQESSLCKRDMLERIKNKIFGERSVKPESADCKPTENSVVAKQRARAETVRKGWKIAQEERLREEERARLELVDTLFNRAVCMMSNAAEKGRTHIRVLLHIDDETGSLKLEHWLLFVQKLTGMGYRVTNTIGGGMEHQYCNYDITSGNNSGRYEHFVKPSTSGGPLPGDSMPCALTINSIFYEIHIP